MNSHKIGSKNKKNTTFKYISLFLFGILFALMTTQALTIVTGIENAVQYIKQIVVTSDGTASGTTGVFIEGLSGKVGANRFCDKNLTNCKKIDSIVTTGELTLYLTGSALVPYVMDDEINTLATSSLTCTNGQIPKSNGSTRSCQADTDTDKYFSTASFNTSNGIVTLSGAGGQSNVTLSLEGRYRTGSDIIKTDTNGASVLNGNIGLGITSDSSDRITIAGDMGLYGNIINIYNKFLGGSLFIKGGDGTSVIGVGGEGVDTAGGNIYIVGGGGVTGGNVILAHNSTTTIGRVGIGDATPSYLLDVNGTGRFINAVYGAAFYYNSDIRYKENLELIQNPLDKILSLNGYTFNWKNGGGEDIGVIAQEIEKIFPQAVSTKEDGYKAVEYGHLVAPLIEAIKELNQKIETQQKEIDILKSK